MVRNNNESLVKGKRKNNSRWTVTKEELAGDEPKVVWAEMGRVQRVEHVFCVLLKIAFLLFIIFTFICTLALLADAFKLIGGKGIGDAVQNSKIIQNPISASIVGMVVTLILQSSSTLISILVGMVAGGIITVHQAIPVMMGAEIGASFFNALISLGQSGNRDQFRRAFAAATMNDIFNFLAYLVILPLELATGIIEIVSGFFVNPLSGARSNNKFQTLNVITDPILHKIVQLNEEALSKITTNKTAVDADPSSLNESLVLKCADSTSKEFSSCPYDHLFANSTWSDTWIGITLLALSIILLVLCLISIVHLLNSLLAGRIAIWVRRIIDKELPHPFGWLTNYLVMLFGCFVVMIVQSSGVFRSALIPLCGIGVVTLERFYPLLLGANVGTTFTGVLAALSADPKQIKETMQIALCQTVYNILSILFFYPVPFTRRIPITLAMKFGDLTAKYRWFALVYIAFVFFLMPGTLLLISFLPPGLTISILALLGGFLAFIVLVNLLQNRCPRVLPTVLQNWKFLPKHLRSLEPYDRIMTKLLKMLPFFRSINQSDQQRGNRNDNQVARKNENEEKQQVRIPFRFISPQYQHVIHPFHSNIPVANHSTHFPSSPPVPIVHTTPAYQTDV